MLVVAPEIQLAVARGEPVVALETTLIAHGIPKPRNLELARALEATIKQAGAVPATIGIVDGAAHVGLTKEQLTTIAQSPDVVKCTTRDLARVIMQGQLGATTIASTIYLAKRAGIRFLATGGLGGVHPGGALSMDVSADLAELARSPVAVFCSGPKIILDLPLTMEFLETHGIAVVGHGCHKLPGFYLRETEIDIPCLPSPKAIADLLAAHAAIGWPGSVVIANPPPDSHAFEPDEFAQILANAHQQAEQKQIKGNALTPFQLAAIAKLTAGRSVALNEALVIENAQLAAHVANLVTSVRR